MTFIPTTVATTAGANAAAAAAAKRKREERREEEQMTSYNNEALDGWEFKIVRASTRKFKDPEFVRLIREEEANAGWDAGMDHGRRGGRRLGAAGFGGPDRVHFDALIPTESAPGRSRSEFVAVRRPGPQESSFSGRSGGS